MLLSTALTQLPTAVFAGMQTHREAEDEAEDEFDFPFALPSRRSVREALGVQRRAPNYEVLSPAHRSPIHASPRHGRHPLLRA